MSQFHVRVANEDLVFSAAHFITFDNGVCEPLHGHDFRVIAEVFGLLGSARYVVDFLALHDMLKQILDELDHAVLLPAEHPVLRMEASEHEVEVRFGSRRWVFPREECRLLPIVNTTAELLASYLASRLWKQLGAVGSGPPERICVAVEESPGQTAVCEMLAP